MINCELPTAPTTRDNLHKMPGSRDHSLTPAPSRTRGHQWAAEWPWIAGAAVYLLIFYVLPPPAPLAPGMDQSYFAMLSELFLRGAQFGRDIIFTMGPWGFLQQPRGNLDIFSWALFGRSILAVAASVGAGSLAVRQIRPPGVRMAWLFLFLVFADPIFAIPFLLVATSIADESGKEDWRYLFLVPACGLVGEIKFTALILVGSLVVFFLIDCLAFRRRFPWTPIGMILSLFAFHLLARQRLEFFIAYLKTSLSITSSYSSVFSTPGSVLDLAVGCLLCGVIALTWTAALVRGRRWTLLPLSCWIFVYLFLNFKFAFVRSDPFHVLWGMFDMVIPAGLVLLILLPGLLQDGDGAFGGKSVWRLASSPWILTPAAAIAISILVFGRYLPESYRIQGTVERLRRIPLTFNTERRKEVYSQEIAAQQREHPLGHLDGTVALFGYQVYLLPLWNLNTNTIPMLQSNEAQNRELTLKDVEFLSGPTAPDHVLFSPDTIDRHLPAMEDSLAWLTLLSKYEPAGFCGSYLHLQRSNHSLVITKDKLFEKDLKFGDKVLLPQEGPLWAELDVHFNLLGRVAGLFYKLPAVKMIADNGTSSRDYRVLPGTAAAGFLLSPVISKAAQFEQLYSGKVQADAQLRSISFQISPAVGQRLFSSDLKIRVYRLRVPQRSNDLAATGEAEVRRPGS